MNEHSPLKLIHGDCIEKLKELEENSVDAIVTDPPYGLSFMGKKWDYDVPSIEMWKEAFRVLKPGGYLLSFAGTRTYHRMAINIEDAGFEIRDCIMWLYGSGFPKSLNIGKQIDKMNGKYENDFTLFGNYVRECREKKGLSRNQVEEKLGTNTALAWWEGRNYLGKFTVQLPDKRHYQELKELLEMDNRFDKLIDWQEAEREVIGVNPNQRPSADKDLYSINGQKEFNLTKGNSEWEGWGTALKPACEPIVVARKPLSEKNVALNVLKWGTGGINIDACRIGSEMIRSSGDKKSLQVWKENDGRTPKDLNLIENTPHWNQGRFPANIILDEEAGRLLDEQTGLVGGDTRKSKSTYDKGIWGNAKPVESNALYNDKGGASRFFKNIEKDNIYKWCSLCYNTLDKDSNKEWKNTNVNNVEKNLITTQVTKENSVQKNVMEIPREKLDQVVGSVENLCPKCVTDFVQNLVVISESQKDSQSQQELQVMQDFIQDYKKCILLQNLVNYVEILDNIDTTQTTQNLLKLFGSVQNVIEDYIKKDIRVQEELKSEPRRFLYQAKASKSERNFGLDNFEEDQVNDGRNKLPDNAFQRGTTLRKNVHPTVKPIKLMEYLVKLVTKENAVVLDPFLGSGTTGIACKKLNRNFIGIEREEEYVKIAEARIKSEVQTRLEVIQ